MKPLDDLMTEAPVSKATEEKANEKVVYLDPDVVYPFKGHPYGVREDDAMRDLREQIKQSGNVIFQPGIVRPRPEGGYEAIIGHRRQYLAKELGIKLPVIIKNLNDHDAMIMMLSSNPDRTVPLIDRLKAAALKMADMSHQGAKPTLSQNGTNLEDASVRTDVIVAKELGMSRSTFRRLLHLLNLMPEMQELTIPEAGKLRLQQNVAINLSYLSKEHQLVVYQEIQTQKRVPTLDQSEKLKSLSDDGKLTPGDIARILYEEEIEKPAPAPAKKQQKEKDPDPDAATYAQFQQFLKSIQPYFPSNWSQDKKAEILQKFFSTYAPKLFAEVIKLQQDKKPSIHDNIRKLPAKTTTTEKETVKDPKEKSSIEVR